MIHEVDEALRELVRNRALPGSDVEVAFEAPTKEWAARRNAPTVNVYLYDIREDLRKRNRGMLNSYDAQGKIEARHLPPRYIKLSYLLTAWTQRPEDEHRLLSSLMGSLFFYDALPKDILTGSLADLGMDVQITTALPPPEDRSFADVWTALGGELKPSLDVVISAPMMTGRVWPAAPIASTGMTLAGVDTQTGEVDEPLRHHVEYIDDEDIVAAGGDGSGRRVSMANARGGGSGRGGKGRRGGSDGADGSPEGEGGGASGGDTGAAGGGAAGAAASAGGTAAGGAAGGLRRTFPAAGGSGGSVGVGPNGQPMPRITMRRRLRIAQRDKPADGGSTGKGSGQK
ncbi:DUF4255 domain-containing protein [Fodinicola acaciae]|uniref:DUF4255 domain-containing protein n=1 Tax=Fodinicola acaciae TaxID=2681555 RepID=UPI001C9E7A24|nr:DUF4255 domain-containing protein [Fodinicola acaciae]